MSCRAILFDLDGVLVDSRECIELIWHACRRGGFTSWCCRGEGCRDAGDRGAHHVSGGGADRRGGPTGCAGGSAGPTGAAWVARSQRRFLRRSCLVAFVGPSQFFALADR